MAAKMKAAALAAVDLPLVLLLVLTSPIAFLELEADPPDPDLDIRILPSRAALAALTLLTPQALQSVLGPRGPSLHWGVLVAPHWEQHLPAVLTAAVIFALFEIVCTNTSWLGEKGLGGFLDLFLVGVVTRFVLE
jgi:hypothetical protein